MPPIKTLLLQISVNIIRIQMPFHGLPGISLNVSGVLIFLTPMNSAFPLLNPSSRHDSRGFLETWFRMNSFLPDPHVGKWLLNSAHDAMPYYIYCRKNHIRPFIDLNIKRGFKVKSKNDFTIGEDGVSVCKARRRMRHDGSKPSKGRLKFRCPLASRKYGCSCTHPCSDSKYGRTIHL